MVFTNGMLGPAVRAELNALSDNIQATSPSGIDDTVAIQAAITAFGFFRGRPGASYTISDTITLKAGNNFLDLNGATINVSFGVNYSKALFKADGTNSTNVYFKDMVVRGNCMIFDMRFLTTFPNAGMKLIGSGLDFNTMDGNRRAGTGAILAEQIDFVNVSNTSVVNCDLPIKLGNHTGRNCTQIYFSNWYVAQVNTGAVFEGVDKMAIDGLDVAKCNSGLAWVGSNARHNLRNVHVEGLGYASYTSKAAAAPSACAGYGYWFADNAQNLAVKINQSSLIDLATTGGSAVGGVYIGECFNPTIQSVEFDGCAVASTAEGSASYKPIVNRGKLRWRGAWAYTTQPLLNDNGRNYIDNAIEDIQTNLPTSENLLGGTTPHTLLLDWATLNGGATPPTITELTAGFSSQPGFSVVFNGSNEQFCRIVSLAIGWHTLWIKGRRTAGNPAFLVQLNGSPFTDVVKSQLVDTTGNDTLWRLAFYNATPGQSYKVGFTCSSVSSTFYAQSLGLVRGLIHNQPPLHQGAHIVGALPTASVLWFGLSVIVRASGVADKYYVCTRNSSSAFIWTQLI